MGADDRSADSAGDRARADQGLGDEDLGGASTNRRAAVEQAIEAAAFRRLLAHLAERTDVQNIDLMNLAGFCRNCLSRWYREEAATLGVEVPDAEARERVYGMPYPDWKARYQSGPQQPLGAPAGHTPEARGSQTSR